MLVNNNVKGGWNDNLLQKRAFHRGSVFQEHAIIPFSLHSIDGILQFNETTPSNHASVETQEKKIYIYIEVGQYLIGSLITRVQRKGNKDVLPAPKINNLNKTR